MELKQTFRIYKVRLPLELVIEIIRDDVSESPLLFTGTNNCIGLGIEEAVNRVLSQ